MDEVRKRYGVGYALAPKKEASFVQYSLVNLAKDKGIDLIRIDPNKPLIDQGPFDCVLHKLYGQDWKNQLEEYSSKNPNVLIIDDPEAIERLRSRISMLDVVKELEIENKTASFGIPKQIVIYESKKVSELEIEREGLRFPVIAKPLVADGSATSHIMSLLFNNDGLNKLKPPIVLQEFVNHGGVIFKVYVVGEYVQCVKRKSLPDVRKRYGVGYALAPKKEASFVQYSLVNLAKDKGIDLIRIDPNKPLIDQGPFDCVLHKLYGQDWKNQLEEYSSKNPNVLIIDDPEAIERLRSRISMLDVVKELEIENKTASFGIPKQIVIYESKKVSELEIEREGLRFPVIAKPLVADGSATSHIMSLLFNNDGLNKLKPPIVLQEFVNHGGVIFKVYVVGEYVQCVKRKSLPDVTEEKLRTLEGSLSFSQISNLNCNEKMDDQYYEMMNSEDADMPPMSFIVDIANGLRKAMKLHFFNFGVIRDNRVGNMYLVIDINYFPGYAKMPGYESVLTDFFLDVLNKKEKDCESRKVGGCEKEESKLVGNNGCGEDDVGLPV
ncbi:unnamed protein product [Ilex paraguariensis]|uniref:Inositol-tetrakisphosphate 1-kinase 1 n=1 Tax=Ilex paraguariensis TaxID=185542 RepID=A0ABC8U2Y3_9AQUA